MKIKNPFSKIYEIYMNSKFPPSRIDEDERIGKQIRHIMRYLHLR
jgi:hypothetical protein